MAEKKLGSWTLEVPWGSFWLLVSRIDLIRVRRDAGIVVSYQSEAYLIFVDILNVKTFNMRLCRTIRLIHYGFRTGSDGPETLAFALAFLPFLAFHALAQFVDILNSRVLDPSPCSMVRPGFVMAIVKAVSNGYCSPQSCFGRRRALWSVVSENKGTTPPLIFIYRIGCLGRLMRTLGHDKA